jgi:deoxyribonuclease IV
VTHYIGCHAIDAGGIDKAVARAADAGGTALQIFSAVPKFYNEKVSVKPDRVARFQAALAAAGMAPDMVIVHAGYVLNTASPEEEKATRAAAALAKELERTSALGVRGCCFHPGSAGSGDLADAIARVGDAVVQAIEANPQGARVLVENTAGAGKTVGRTPEEVAGILARVPAALRGRAGYGLDTCHLYAAGYDISASAAALRGVLDAFADATGEPPAFFHLNDSVGALGSNKDRHAVLGEGAIGMAAFHWLLEDARSQGVPLVLETPQAVPERAEDDVEGDAWDRQSIARLRQGAA